MGKQANPSERTSETNDTTVANIKGAVGDVLRELRMAKNLTQEELGLQAGRERVFISNLERGLQSPTVVTLFALSRILKVPVSQILKEVEEKLVGKTEGE